MFNDENFLIQNEANSKGYKIDFSLISSLQQLDNHLENNEGDDGKKKKRKKKKT